ELFFSAIIKIYNSTIDSDYGLRNLIIQMIKDNLGMLRAKENPILDKTLLKIIPDFILEICLSALDKCAEQDKRWDY
ncbi:hypothetical protein P170DRAFT_360772, partial [Aspergillus steynii IBT 23096]